MSDAGDVPPYDDGNNFDQPGQEDQGDQGDQGDQQAVQKDEPTSTEHLNIKVTDGNNEVFFKIKRTTQFKKLMDVFCQRQGKDPRHVRFLFDGQRVNETDNPDKLDMDDGDALEVHQEQIGG